MHHTNDEHRQNFKNSWEKDGVRPVAERGGEAWFYAMARRAPGRASLSQQPSSELRDRPVAALHNATLHAHRIQLECSGPHRPADLLSRQAMLHCSSFLFATTSGQSRYPLIQVRERGYHRNEQLWLVHLQSSCALMAVAHRPTLKRAFKARKNWATQHTTGHFHDLEQLINHGKNAQYKQRLTVSSSDEAGCTRGTFCPSYRFWPPPSFW
jgi:hypothetical protein